MDDPHGHSDQSAPTIPPVKPPASRGTDRDSDRIEVASVSFSAWTAGRSPLESRPARLVPGGPAPDGCQMPPGLTGRFEAIKVLGRGGMGVVLLCRDKQLERDVAVKVIAGSGRGLEKRLSVEAQVLAGLEHQNVVRLYDLGSADGCPYIVMEYVRGMPLSARLALGRPTLVEAVRLCREIIAGLEVAHQKGIAHFDLKPSNIFLDEAGVAKVADFGLARAIGGERSKEGQEHVGGTPGYMAPEQWANEAGLPADIYAVGVILVELLTGRPLLRGASWTDIMRLQLLESLPTPASLNPSVPPVLDRIAMRCLATEPAERPSLEELSTVLGAWHERVTKSRRRAPAAGFPAHPYRFLDCFGVPDAAIFFGRDAETTELAAMLELEAVRLLLVWGPCGVGKSSLLRAGLGRAVDPGTHRLSVLIAGPAPARRILEALAAWASANGVAPDGAAPSPDALEAEPRRVRALLAALSAVPHTLVLVLDQVEEVFTQNPPGSRAAADFFALVSSIVESQTARLKLVLAYREEFRGDMFPLEQRLAPLLQSYPVGEIEEAGLVEAIEGPSHIEFYEFAYEPELARRIARDIVLTSRENRSPSLPALQITCRQLFDRLRGGGGRVIDLALYERELGGARGALERYVKESLAGPAYAHQGALARQILEALTVKDGERERFACARDVEELVDFPDRAAAHRTLDQLVADRLVTLDIGEDGQRQARLASEVICTVIDGWAADPDQAQLAGRALARSYRLWVEHAKAPEYLLEGPLLTLVAHNIDRLLSVEDEKRAFIASSLSRRRSARALRASAGAMLVLFALGWLWAAFLRPGSLELTSDPPGARVLRQGKLLGTTPLSLPAWPGGVPLRFELEGHDPLDADVVVRPGGVTAFGPSLRYTRGVLDVRSDPPGALVTIAPTNGQDAGGAGLALGPTPLTTEVPRGAYRVSLALPGWETHTLPEVEVRDKRQLTHRVVKLRQNAGWLTARTPRENARLVLSDPITGRVALDAALPLPAPAAVPSGAYLAECVPLQGGRVDYQSVAMGVRTTRALSPWIPAVGALWTVKGLGVDQGGSGADLDGDGRLDLVVGTRDGFVHALAGGSGHEIWRYRTGGTVICTPAIADLDGDGVPDAAVTSHDGKVHAISGRTGEPLWIHASGAKMQVSPAVGDLDRDRVPDLVAGSTDRSVFALSGRDGRVLWSFRTGGSIYSDPALADLDGDEVPDAVIGSNDGVLYALSGKSGAPLWRRELGGPIASGVQLARLDPDATPDALVIAADRSLRALSGTDGRELWAHRDVDGTPLLIGDVDADRVVDVACVSADYRKVYGVSGATGRALWTFRASANLWPNPVASLAPDGTRRVVVASASQVYVLAPDGRPLWGLAPGGAMSGPPAVVDLDADGLGDVIAAVGDTLVAVSASLGNHRWAFQTDGHVRTQPALALLDGDAVPDVVAGGGHRVVALSGATGDPLWSYDAGAEPTAGASIADLDRDGTPDAVVPGEGGRVHAVSGRDGRRLWSHDAGGLVETRAALADLDGDAVPDAVVGTAAGALMALSGRSGARLWSRAAAGVVADPAAADLDGDGAPDVVAADLDGGVVALAGRSGRPLWTAKVQGAVKRALVAADLDGDGRVEVVVAGESGTVSALEGRSGAVRWMHRAPAPAESAPLVLRRPEAQVVVARVDGVLCVLAGGDGSVRWTHRFAPDRQFDEAPPEAVDLDGDGQDDIVVAYGDHVYGLEGGTGRVLFRTSERFVSFTQPRVRRASDRALTLVACSAATVVSRQLGLPIAAGDAARLWRVITGDAITGSPSVSYFEKDGHPAAVFGGVDGQVRAVSLADGRPRWVHDAGSAVRSSPALVALTTGARADVVVGSDGGRVALLDGATGRPRWRFEAGAPVIATPAVGDVNDDGTPDAILGTKKGRLVAISGRNGAELWSVDVGSPIISSPALADLDADGAREIVFGADDGKLRALRVRDGSALWTTALSPRRVRSSPAVMAGRAGQAAVVVCGTAGSVLAVSGRDGHVVWSVPMKAPAECSPALADLDGDGQTDVAIGSSDGALHALSGSDGRVLWVQRTGGRITGRPAVGDVDGDGRPDVVAGSFDGLVHAFSGTSGKRLFVRGAGGPIDWSGPALADLDGDGTLDVLVGNQLGELVALPGGLRLRRKQMREAR